MYTHQLPICVDARRDCNNLTKTGKCIALIDAEENCKFYCAIADTDPQDTCYHLTGTTSLKKEYKRYLHDGI